jgi:VanZ family protein
MIIFRRAALAAFVVYTLALLTATHWPGLTVQGPVQRTDLVLHFGAFFTWTVLLALTGLTGRSARRLILTGLVFSVLDETTQPLFDRTLDALDLLSNAAGVCFGAGVVTLARRWLNDFRSRRNGADA